MLTRKSPVRWWSSFLWIIATYVLFVDVLPNVLLLIVNCIGYLPYSDRPGPGWQPPHVPSKGELSFFIGFGAYMLRPTALYGFVFAVVGVLFGWCSLPRWLMGLVGGVFAFFTAATIMAAAGWMIAISSLGVYLAAACGLLWGAAIFPFAVWRNAFPPPLAMRILVPAILLSTCLFFLVRPFLPQKSTPAVAYEVERVTPGSQEIDWQPYCPYVVQACTELKALHLKGQLHGGVQGGMSGTSAETVDMVVVALEPIAKEYRLAVPSSGHVIYVMKDGSAISYPRSIVSSGRWFVLKPGDDPNNQGGQLQDPGMDSFHRFIWFPTIHR